MDKSSEDCEDQGDWRDSEESEEISIHLPDTDNETKDNEILPRRRKCVTSFNSTNMPLPIKCAVPFQPLGYGDFNQKKSVECDNFQLLTDRSQKLRCGKDLHLLRDADLTKAES
ncbi:hypothetical protein AVEN_78110-1 [Araneus ventricosus]|uniref:Uncharacterized protein n=1 Tax=Araneus ventricosus TaxID=182803 RepID=A0A4Y2F5D9_ARAVE|nr:hypothetical protein AVEN_78110-1 [Araneus ventricosus]